MQMTNAMAKNMPLTTATKLLPAVEPLREKHIKTERTDNGDMNLTISGLNGEKEEDLSEIIARYMETLSHSKVHMLGYPCNLAFDHEALARLLHFYLNNIGDPFMGNSFSLNSFSFEVSVLDWFASLWEIERSDYWGYVTTGGTEGNLHGILIGRENFPDGILYTSHDSHYSVFKIARMYRMQCVKVATLPSGEINCDDLKALLLVHKNKPAIINLNIGTTVKGAVDDLDLVLQTLKENDFTHDQFYIHCDGALFGMMLPFINQASKINFKKPIGSISISGHKFLGCPIPCGVVLTRLEYIKGLSTDVEYIASRDATITGSRSGHAPIFLWYALKKKGLMGLKREVEKCMANAVYLHNQLRDSGIGAMKNEYSSTIVFERPLDDEFARRWSLACHGNIAHVVVMQHVTIEVLDLFLNEYVHKRSIWYKAGENEPPCTENEIGAANCVCKLHNSLTC